MLDGMKAEGVYMLMSRQDKLSASQRASGIDALALNPSASLKYLTGLDFHLMERPVLVIFPTSSSPVIILPELELIKVENLPFQMQAFPYTENPAAWKDVFRQALRSIGLDGKRIGIEPRQMRVLDLEYLRAGVDVVEFPDASDLVSNLRIYKDQHEVDLLRKAVQIAEKAMEATLPLIKIGMSEKEIASELLMQLLIAGTEPSIAFSPIVSSGPNSANPHANPSDRRIQAGDLLVIDWGAMAGGYVSDLTRTFMVGEAEPEFIKIHRIVQEANTASLEACNPEVPCAAVDIAARSVIEKSGYGQFFTHRTGHGIGMEGHEHPYIRAGNSQLLEAGMTFTVEPGIYLPGRNGVRIEDNVVITGKVMVCMSSLVRDIRVIG